MKAFSRLLSVFMVFVFVASASADPVKDSTKTEKNVNWKNYSQSIVDGIRSENDGVRDAAMRLAIQYSDQIRVADATIDLMRIYRNADSAQLRRLAAVTLASLDSSLADGYLRMSKPYEKNDGVRKTLAALTNH